MLGEDDPAVRVNPAQDHRRRCCRMIALQPQQVHVVGMNGFEREVWIGVKLRGGVSGDVADRSPQVLGTTRGVDPITIDHVLRVFEETPDRPLERGAAGL